MKLFDAKIRLSHFREKYLLMNSTVLFSRFWNIALDKLVVKKKMISLKL